MTARHLVQIAADAIEEAAFRTGREIVRDTAEQRMYLTLDGITFTAPSPDVEVRG